MTETTSQAPFIQLKDVAFGWPGGAFSLRLPAFEAVAGEKLFLVGESGSGKSTFLGLLAGITQPQGGQVILDGTDLATLSGAQRDRFRAERIGVIFQMFNLLPYASALENILLPLSFAPARRRTISDPKAEALRLTGAMGLNPDLVRNARASELSIGQQQRVAAARALISAPSLVIADEPTSALDASNQQAFLDVLMSQVEAVGATLVMVSHDKRLAAGFDRVLDITEISTTQRRAA